MFWGGALLFLESIIKLWHICRTNIKINKPLQIISRHYTQHLYSFEQRSDNQCINVNYTDMLWISSLNINKIKHFERIVIRWDYYYYSIFISESLLFTMLQSFSLYTNSIMFYNNFKGRRSCQLRLKALGQPLWRLKSPFRPPYGN